jgi:hypothetical protein
MHPLKLFGTHPKPSLALVVAYLVASLSHLHN